MSRQSMRKPYSPFGVITEEHPYIPPVANQVVDVAYIDQLGKPTAIEGSWKTVPVDTTATTSSISVGDLQSYNGFVYTGAGTNAITVSMPSYSTWIHELGDNKMYRFSVLNVLKTAVTLANGESAPANWGTIAASCEAECVYGSRPTITRCNGVCIADTVASSYIQGST